MAYLTLYRKYRSQTFEDLVGQEHITKTLQNAIARGKIGHAYLFTGPRGTGKTSTARLIAKALNCVNGPTPTPCNECATCKSITDGRSLDVQEIDGASNRRIDDIRSLRETVKYVSAEGGWKVYVIDEVHMLVDEAFNALLKTLEEPPERVIFILCTTHPHEVPPTIHSRCQRFDFRRGSRKVIFDRIADIAKREGIEADPAALQVIAEDADGSFRDGLALLEQVWSYAGGAITRDDAIAVLGRVSEEYMHEAVRLVASQDLKGVFDLTGTLSDVGVDLPQFAKGLADYARNLLVASAGADSGYQPSDAERFNKQAKSTPPDLLVRIIEEANEAEREMKWNDAHRLVLELAFAKLIARRADVRAAQPTAAPVAHTTPPVERQATTTPAKQPAVLGPVADSPAPPDPFAIPADKSKCKGATSTEHAAAPATDDDIDNLKAKWPQVLAAVRAGKGNSPRAYLMLREAVPLRIEGRVIYLGFPKTKDFHRGQIETPKLRQAIEDHVAAAFAPGYTIRAELSDVPEQVDRAQSDSGSLVRDSQLISKALEMFDGELLDG